MPAGRAWRKYENIGVGIGDDVLITGEGNRILSGEIPKEINEIEKLMQGNARRIVP